MISTRVQPYSMGPLLGYAEPAVLMPESGTSVRMDVPQLPIMFMWRPPASVVAAAKAAGWTSPPRMLVPGLADMLAKGRRQR